MIAALMLIALSGAPPAIDPGKICRNAHSAVTPDDAKAATESCVRDEEAARDKLKGRWSHYSATARAACREDGLGVAASYVEMWTCLEMQPGGSLSLTASNPAGTDSKLLPGAGPATGAPAGRGAAGGSGVTPGGAKPAGTAPSAGAALAPGALPAAASPGGVK